MQNKLLSIVIPVFNIEQYITKCIDSFEKVNEKYYSLFIPHFLEVDCLFYKNVKTLVY